MGTQYNGLSGNVSKPGPLTVSTVSGLGFSPIVVATTAQHGLTAGDVVDVAGVTGNTATNGRGIVQQVLSSTQFTLSGSTPNGNYAGGGVVQPRTLSPSTFTIPKDGDSPATAASVSGPLMALGDRSAWLEKYVANGTYYLVDTAFSTADTPMPLTGGTATTLTSQNTWFASGLVKSTFNALLPGDVLITDWSISLAGSGTTPTNYASIWSNSSGGYAILHGSEEVWVGTNVQPVMLKAYDTVPVTPIGTSYNVQLYLATSLTGSPQTLYYGYTFEQRLYRAT